MKRRKTKKKIKKCLKKIKELGFSFSRASVSYDSCVFEISELPDFLWGIWMKRNYGINPAYFGDLKWFYDKFYPSRSPYSYTSLMNSWIIFVYLKRTTKRKLSEYIVTRIRPTMIYGPNFREIVKNKNL